MSLLLKEKLLTGTQRKALEKLVQSHGHKLAYDFRAKTEAEGEPENVIKARKLVEAHEEAKEQKITQFENAVIREVKRINHGLLFDSVGEACQKARDFELSTADDITWLKEIQ